MQTTRARFKQSLRYCRSIETRARADAIARKFLTKNSTSFWKSINNIYDAGKTSTASCVDGVVGESEICRRWKEHYSNLLNSNNDVSVKEQVISQMKQIDEYGEVQFSVNEVKAAVNKIKLGKSPGPDGLEAEYFKYACDKLYILIALCFNFMMHHSYVPGSLMTTIIVPIVKDKRGLITDKDNYRPIAITTIASKIFESLILNRTEDLLITHANQFGFKAKHSTDKCVFS